MTGESLIEKIEIEKPRAVYLSGKTCTGKTTFANLLEKKGYARIELDKVVEKSVVGPFNVAPGDGFLAAYRGEGPSEQTSAFIAAAKKDIEEKLQTFPVVAEGAISKAEILREVFRGVEPGFLFVYFHPTNRERYEERIMTRFVAGAHDGTSGLPKHFWEHVKDDDMKAYLATGALNDGLDRAIAAYAELSMRESGERLRHFQESFPDICIVKF